MESPITQNSTNSQLRNHNSNDTFYIIIALYYRVRKIYTSDSLDSRNSWVSDRIRPTSFRKSSASSWRPNRGWLWRITREWKETVEHPVIPEWLAVRVSGNRSNDRKMHWSWFSTGSTGRIGRGSLLNHLAAREVVGERPEERSIFAMEIEIVPVCKPHWNVLPAEMATAVQARALLGTLGVVCDTCVDFPTRSMYQLRGLRARDRSPKNVHPSERFFRFALRPELRNRLLDGPMLVAK